MKAIVLSDNIAANGLSGEWGLSIYIEYGEKKILLDTGASGLFSKNAEKLGVRLKDVDYGVLSHAHYDHANGMKTFFAENSKASFYLREGCGEDCYFKKWVFHKYIGIPRRILSEYADRLVFAQGVYELEKGIYLVPHTVPGLDRLGKRENMYRRKPGGWYPDDFSHEQSLVLETGLGLIILNSCSHGGAANIIQEVSDAFPGKKVYGIIGGFHLYNKSEAEVRLLSHKIKQTGAQYVCTGHCTKEKAYGILKEELRESLHQLHVNMVMEFE